MMTLERPQKVSSSSAWEDKRSVTSSVAEYNAAKTTDVTRCTQQQGDVMATLKARDYVLHWCYSKYLQVRVAYCRVIFCQL